MAYSIPLPLGGLRGSGLGNQAIVLGKAWIASEVLGHTLVDLPWALNPRKYSREVGGTLVSAAAYVAAVKGLAPRRITSEDYIDSGEVDYGDFLLARRTDLGLSRTIVHASGMTGGYIGIVRARNYLKRRFLFDVKAALSVLAHIDRVKLDAMVVSVHVRAGDFGEQQPEPGAFNRRSPMGWYLDSVRDVIDSTTDDISIQVATEPDAIRQVQTAFSPFRSTRVSVEVNSRTSTEDLAVLSAGDLLITSVSSFSLLGAFLGQSPYIWYRPQTSGTEARRQIWADPESLHFAGLIEKSEGPPAPYGRGLLSPGQSGHRETLDRLSSDLDRRRPLNDLLMYGGVSGD